MIQNFNDLFAELKAKNICKKMVAAWAVDEHTIEAASLASDMGFVKCTLVGDEDLIKKVCADNNIDVAKFEIVDIKDELKAVAQAVKMVHDGEGEVLMKGLCSTDKFLRAILNKETGLLPPKGVLSHVGVIENPNYMLDSMPACIEGAMLAKMCDRGQIKGCIGDGPLALDVWMSPSTRSPWRSRSSSARLPATPTASSSRTSSPAMSSGRPTPSCAPASARPASSWA